MTHTPGSVGEWVPGRKFVQGDYELEVLMSWPAKLHGTNLLCRWPDGWTRPLWKPSDGSSAP